MDMMTNSSYPHGDGDIDMLRVLQPVSHLWLSGARVPVYSYSPILSGDFDSERLSELLRVSHPVDYPYNWYVFGQQGFVLNMFHLQSLSYYRYPQPQSSPSYSTQPQEDEEEEAIDEYEYEEEEVIDEYEYEEEAIDEYEYIDEVAIMSMNDSFQQSSGLTDRFVSENLMVINHHKDEENEICVVCQEEFEKEEMVGMLQCKHQFHPNCIKEWLLRNNVCPLCKAEAFKV